MFDKRELERYADVLLWGLSIARKEPYANNDVILVSFDLKALPLAEALYARCIEKHFHPIIRMAKTPAMELALYEEGSMRQLGFVPPGEDVLIDNLAGWIRLLAPASLTHLGHVDPERFGVVQKAHKPYRDQMNIREERGGFTWTLCLYPTEALANSAGLTIDEYADQIRKACWLGMDHPEREWKRIWEQAQEVKAWMTGMQMTDVHIESANTDLRLNMGQDRRFLGVTGHNIPSFEIYTSPDWRGANGVFYADMPSYKNGNLVTNARLEFKDGVCTGADAEEGGQYLRQQLTMDLGASRIGEFSLTDRRFSRIDRFMAHTLYDENFGGECGNCHVALGSAYAESAYAGDRELTQAVKDELGFNNSALHWDMVNTEDRRVTATLPGGEKRTIYENGEFTL
jgi:aminopeptidase